MHEQLVVVVVIVVFSVSVGVGVMEALQHFKQHLRFKLNFRHRRKVPRNKRASETKNWTVTK